jgi:hypothetical protein
MADLQLDFKFELADAYSFKHALTLVKDESPDGTSSFIFSPSGIEINLLSKNSCIYHHLVLRGSSFTNYYYDIRDDNNNIAAQYSLGFSTLGMHNAVKTLLKKDRVLIYKVKGEETRLTVMPLRHAENGPPLAIYVDIKQHNSYRVTLPPNYPDTPQLQLKKNVFRDLFKQLITNKCSAVEFRVFSTQLQIRGILSTGTAMADAVYPFDYAGTASANPDDNQVKNMQSIAASNLLQIAPTIKVKLPALSIKVLSKIHNVAPNDASLKFHFVRGAPILVRIPIGNYGEYEFALREAPTDNK